MQQTWVTISQIQRLYKVDGPLLGLFLRRLNIMSDTLRSSRSRSRTSSSWFHNWRRSCWRRGCRQVGERPSAPCAYCHTLPCAASRLLLCCFFNWLNCCHLSPFVAPQETWSASPATIYSTRPARTGKCSTWYVSRLVNLSSIKNTRVLTSDARKQQWAWARFPLLVVVD